MPHGRITAPPYHRPQRKRRKWQHRQSRHGSRKWQGTRRPHPPPPYRLPEFGAAYIAALSVCVTVSGALAQSGQAVAIPVIGIVYLGCGIALSRFVHRRVRWLRWRANVAIVAQVKIRTIVGWPVSLPVFIAQLCIAKHF